MRIYKYVHKYARVHTYGYMNLGYRYFWTLGVIKRKTASLLIPTFDPWAKAIVGFPLENLLKMEQNYSHIYLDQICTLHLA